MLVASDAPSSHPRNNRIAFSDWPALRETEKAGLISQTGLF